jgi:hypothetical protein
MSLVLVLEYSKCTYHFALRRDERPKIMEYLGKFVYPGLNLANLSFPLLNQGLLVSKLLWRELLLEQLRLALLR